MSATSISPSSPTVPAAAGVTGAYDGDSASLKIIIAFFAGLAMYNSIELSILVFMTFSRYRGLYFWSLLISSLGIIPYALGFLFKFFNILTGPAKWVSVTLLSVGWYPMITGQSIILWSRLHLIVSGEKGQKILKYTKWMIIVDAIIFHIPTTVVTYGSNGTIDTANFVKAYNVVEKIQMTGFFIQEVVLSSIYIVETINILRTSLKPHTRRLMRQLVFINVVIIIMDVALLSMECASLYLLETVFKGTCYSIKLKLEFAILSRLVKFVGGSQKDSDLAGRPGPMAFLDVEKNSQGKPSPDDNDVSDFVDMTRISTDITHASPPIRRARSSLYGDSLDFDFAQFEHVESAKWEDNNDEGGDHDKDPKGKG